MNKKLSKIILQSMEQINAAQNPAKLSPILAFDYGEKMSGLAWSPDGIVVFPIEVVDTAKSREILLQTYAEKNCQQLVIGLPVSGDGTENSICQKIKKFAKSLEIKNIKFVNERNSSQETFFRGKSNQPKPRIDDLAAARILEYWLES
jgi:putative transcription antitermination factor YqgF